MYPIALNTLISRSNVGSDADIRLIGYSLSCTLATGNDCSTVSINIGHAGPWVRRGDSATDSFDQQFLEHTIRGKSCLFRKFLLGSSEKQYLNPDTSNNFLYLRIRDPCGVIPGVVVKLEFRAHLIRRTPSAFFANGDQDATDRYEDQDVTAGSRPSPGPPSAVKHVPAVILVSTRSSIADDDTSNSQFNYYQDGNTGGRPIFTVSYTNPKQTIGAVFRYSGSNLQSAFNAAGFDGTISEP